MKLLKEIVRYPGMNLDGKTIYREAVRGVAIKDDKLLMIYSSKNVGYKFPGGGIEIGETHKEALIREIKEECGATVLSIDGELGKTIEFGFPIEEKYDVFKMASYYYTCEVGQDFGEQSLEQYEKDLGFNPIWVNIDEAISVNQMLINSKKAKRWMPRDTFVLKYIKENIK